MNCKWELRLPAMVCLPGLLQVGAQNDGACTPHTAVWPGLAAGAGASMDRSDLSFGFVRCSLSPLACPAAVLMKQSPVLKDGNRPVLGMTPALHPFAGVLKAGSSLAAAGNALGLSWARLSAPAHWVGHGLEHIQCPWPTGFQVWGMALRASMCF